MSLFTVDSNNTFGRNVEEAGTYNVKIVRSEATTAKSGNSMVTVDYEVIDGKYQGGQIRYQNLVWNAEDSHSKEISIKRFNTFVVALGAKDGQEINNLQQIADSALGKELSVDTEWGDPNYNGQVYLQVRGYHLVNPDGSKPNGVRRPNSSQTESTNKQPVGAGTTNKPPFSGNVDSIEISDDDLPF